MEVEGLGITSTLFITSPRARLFDSLPRLHRQDHPRLSSSAEDVIHPEEGVDHREEQDEGAAVMEPRAPSQDRDRQTAGEEVAALEHIKARFREKPPDAIVVVELVASVFRDVMSAEGLAPRSKDAAARGRPSPAAQRKRPPRSTQRFAMASAGSDGSTPTGSGPRLASAPTNAPFPLPTSTIRWPGESSR